MRRPRALPTRPPKPRHRIDGASDPSGMKNMQSLIGSRLCRIEDDALLRGRGRFVDDIVVPGVLHCCFVRGRRPHALFRSVSKVAALAAPGVRAVLTLDIRPPVMAKRRMLRNHNSGTQLFGVWC